MEEKKQLEHPDDVIASAIERQNKAIGVSMILGIIIFFIFA